MLKNLKFDHIGVATNNIEATLLEYQKIGYNLSSKIIDDKEQNVKVCLIEKSGAPKVELIEPLNDKSPILKTIEKSGVGPYHFCYKADKFDELIKELYQEGYMLTSKKTYSPLFEREVCFLYNVKLGLIELVHNDRK
jgi:methylmalonyl-CoA/ethylmalonyl-CoA epimerase